MTGLNQFIGHFNVNSGSQTFGGNLNHAFFEDIQKTQSYMGFFKNVQYGNPNGVFFENIPKKRCKNLFFVKI